MLTDTEKALLERIITAVADAPEDYRAPKYSSVQIDLSVPETIALRKLRTSFYASRAKQPLPPKHACL